MRRTYRYRLYPTRKQEQALEAQLRDACDLYNAALEHRRTMWRDYRVSVSFYDQSREVKDLRAAGLISPTANAWSQHAVLRRLDRSFQAFFRRVKAGEKPGYPRFRNHWRYDTLEFSFGHGGISLDSNRLRLRDCGPIRIKMHRLIPYGARLRQARVMRRDRRWYVSISLDGIPINEQPSTGRAVGLDVGISAFVATSDGNLMAGPRAERTASRAVRRARRKVARRQRGSHRRRKAVALLARRREHERNSRRDHAHKTTRALIQQYDLIAVEDLNLRGLARSILARDVHDQGWGQFIALLREKAEEAAREVVLVDPRGTSQTCPDCGAVKRKALGERVHSCPCGCVMDRDVAAARVILTRGLDEAVRRQQWGEEARAVA